MEPSAVVGALARDIGPRLGGSHAAHRAADFVAERMTALGLTVRRQKFKHLGWDYGSPPEVEVLSPEPARLECAPTAFSGATDGPVEGELARDGLLIDVPELLEFERLAIVVDGQRRGLLLVPPVDGTPYPLPLSDPIFQEPAVYVSRADGHRLAELMEHGRVVVRLQTHGTLVSGMSDQNVVGTLDGDDELTIVVGAHFDSAWRSPGAVDNASGVAAMLEVAWRVCQRGCRHTFEFVGFGAEEWFSFGARYFVSEAMRLGKRAHYVAMLNCDPLSVGDTLELWVGPDRLAGRVEQILQDLGLVDRFLIRFREPLPGVRSLRVLAGRNPSLFSDLHTDTVRVSPARRYRGSCRL